jgi:hypothetical protein
MLGTFLLLLFVGVEVSRGGATAQRDFNVHVAPLRRCVATLPAQSEDLTVEVFQVLELPLSVHEARLTKTDKAFLLKLDLGNNIELKMIGLRYSLVTINSKNEVQLIANRVEGFSIPAYATKSITFKTPLKFKSKDGDRLAVMVEQVVSRESIWEVVKAKEAFEAYARGDYSVAPVVLRVANQVDSRPDESRIFFREQ